MPRSTHLGRRVDFIEVCAAYRQAATLHRRCQSGGWLELFWVLRFTLDLYAMGPKHRNPKPVTLRPQL